MSESSKSNAEFAEAVRALAAAAAALVNVARVLGCPDSAISGSPLPSPSPNGMTVSQAIAEMCASKQQAGRSEQYLRQLRNHLKEFAKGRAASPISSITYDDAHEWVYSNGLSARSRWNRATILRTLFSWCVRRRLCPNNPTDALDLPKTPNVAPGIHTPEQVAAILEAARERSLNLCRILAVRYFAGLRTAEAGRLEERDIGPEFINVPASKAKTRQRRLVKIQPALRAWLELGGTMPRRTMEQEMWALVSGSGIPWPRNAARHSWCSYHLAAFGSASNTALEAGHSEAMLFAHYREVVTPAQAAAFWAIRPSGHNAG